MADLRFFVVLYIGPKDIAMVSFVWYSTVNIELMSIYQRDTGFVWTVERKQRRSTKIVLSGRNDEATNRKWHKLTTV